MAEIKTPVIVVGIDGSAESLVALRWALREGVTRQATVEVVHCWQPHTLTDLAFGSPHELSRGSICMVDNEAAAAMAEMTVTPQVIRTSLHARPAKVLLGRSSGACLLVLGTHGHTALRDVVFGKVATNCIKHAPCPVVIVDAQANAVTYDHRRPAESAVPAGLG